MMIERAIEAWAVVVIVGMAAASLWCVTLWLEAAP
jgi:hypothetical protein